MLILLFALLPGTALQPVLCAEPFSCENNENPSWGVGLSGGILPPVSGSLDTGNSSGDVLDTGPNFALSLRKRVSERFSTEITADIGWMNYGRNIYDPSSSFSIAALVLGNSYSIIRTGRLDTCIKAGAGMYFWRVCEGDAFGGARQFEGEEIQKISIGLKAGLGADIAITRRISITAESMYNYVLCKDTFHFGKGFTEQGLVNINIGLMLYLF